MTGFEKFLIDKGYKMHVYDFKNRCNKPTEKHIISTMVNIDHRYILDERVIYFGLHEKNKPPTLIHPRPNINIKRNRFLNGQTIIINEGESYDDSMNVVLNKYSYKDILKAMYDNSIKFNIDLTA